MIGYNWDEDPAEEEQEQPLRVPADVLPSSDEPNELDEVERRLEKAHFYRMLLRHQLISSDSNEAVEVEQEIQDFVRERLAVLLGIKMEKAFNEALPFNPEEVEALKAVAAKVLNRPTIVQAKPEAPKPPPTIKPVQEAPRPAVRPAQPKPEAPKPVVAKRTRQRKGVSMETLQKSVEASTPQAQKTPEVDENKGERLKVVGGKRYKVVDRVVNDPATGKPKLDAQGRPITAEYMIDITPKTDIPKTPFPSLEVMNAMEAAKAQEAMAMNPFAAGLIPTAMTLPDTTQKD
jgi:hypothetical protein